MSFENALKITSLKLGLSDGFIWKDKQLECLKGVYNQKDVVAILPTGYGKSLICQSTPFLLDIKKNSTKDHSLPCEEIIIVITPLNSIMIDQCQQLFKSGIMACYLDFQSNTATTFRESLDMDDSGNITTDINLKDIENKNSTSSTLILNRYCAQKEYLS